MIRLDLRKMRDFAAMDVLDVWYARLDDSDFR